MADTAAPTTREIAIKTAVVIAVSALLVNSAFYLLSDMYFDSHRIPMPGTNGLYDNGGLHNARTAFLWFSLAVSVGAFIASLAPRQVGHGLASALGFAAIYAGVESWRHDMPAVMTAVQLVVGVVLPILSWRSWQAKSRAAWAYLIAIIAVFGVTTFFGAPKVRNVLGIGFWSAMILPGVQFVTVSALAMLRGDYRDV